MSDSKKYMKPCSFSTGCHHQAGKNTKRSFAEFSFKTAKQPAGKHVEKSFQSKPKTMIALNGHRSTTSESVVHHYGFQGMEERNSDMETKREVNVLLDETPGDPVPENDPNQYLVFGETLVEDRCKNIRINPDDPTEIVLEKGGFYEITYRGYFSGKSSGNLQLVLFLNSETGEFPDFSRRTQFFEYVTAKEGEGNEFWFEIDQVPAGGPTKLPALPPNSKLRFRIINGFFEGTQPIQQLNIPDPGLTWFSVTKI